MQIAVMTEEQAEELAELDRLCFAVPWSEKSFRDEAKNSIAEYFTAVSEDGKVVGYGGVWHVSGEGQITNIAVLPSFRRRGIAARILEELIKACEDEERMVLEVRQSNGAAIALYEKYGFKRVGTRKNFYRSPTEDAIIMIRGEC